MSESAEAIAVEEGPASLHELFSELNSQPDPYVSQATREIISSRLEVREGQLFIVSVTHAHSMDVIWPEAIISAAMWFDVRPFLAANKLHRLVEVAPETLATLISEETLTPLTEWSGYEAAKANLLYKTKKGDKKSRIDKVIKTLEDIGLLTAEAVSAQSRLRTLQSASPHPHGETSEMTFGSTVEIGQQMTKIADIGRKLDDTKNSLALQIEQINAKLKPVDSGWQTNLPDQVIDITALNEPLPEGELVLPQQ